MQVFKVKVRETGEFGLDDSVIFRKIPTKDQVIEAFEKHSKVAPEYDSFYNEVKRAITLFYVDRFSYMINHTIALQSTFIEQDRKTYIEYSVLNVIEN